MLGVQDMVLLEKRVILCVLRNIQINTKFSLSLIMSYKVVKSLLRFIFISISYKTILFKITAVFII